MIIYWIKNFIARIDLFCFLDKKTYIHSLHKIQNKKIFLMLQKGEMVSVSGDASYCTISLNKINESEPILIQPRQSLEPFQEGFRLLPFLFFFFAILGEVLEEGDVACQHGEANGIWGLIQPEANEVPYGYLLVFVHHNVAYRPLFTSKG